MSAAAPDWLAAALTCLARGVPCTLVTVAAVEGSAPREAGTKMLVHLDGMAGSVGGGHLEFKALAEAKSLLQTAMAPQAKLLDFALGPSLGQCCGGRVTLLFEPLTPAALPWLTAWQQPSNDRVLLTRLSPPNKIVVEPEKAPRDLMDPLRTLAESAAPAVLFHRDDPGSCYLLERMVDSRQDLYLFGAGHVGQALVQVLSLLPFRVRWIDGRAEMFPAVLPANVEAECSASPRHDVAAAAPGSFFLVMTHSHPTDLEICDQVLKRGDFAFLGLIGSESKRATFLSRLRQRGHGEAALARLTCPIGLPEVTSKEPASIAVAVAGQLLARSEAILRDRLAARSGTCPAEGRYAS
ncbi:MAG: xanthine dehydrogenase accessory protein XdhC [Dongiales bacterium]